MPPVIIDGPPPEPPPRRGASGWPYRLRRRTLRALPVESAVAVSAEALAAATCGQTPITDAALIAQLKAQLEARGRTILDLRRQLDERREPAPAGECKGNGCAGLRQVIAEMQVDERAKRKRAIAEQFANPAERARPLGDPLVHTPAAE